MSSTAITAVNASLAATAAIEADRAHAERCKAELISYAPATASVQQMQSYAACVRKLHPTEESTGPYKVCIATVLVCMVLGAIIGAVRSYYDIIGDAILGGFLGAAAGMTLLLIVGAVLFLIYA